MYDEIKGNASKVSPQEIDKDISTGLILTQKNDIPHDDEWSHKILAQKEKRAREILSDREEFVKFLVKVSNKLDKLEDTVSHSNVKGVELVNLLLKYTSAFFSLLSDYLDGRYTNLPYTTLLTVVCALLYFISPVDVIPDFIPIAGYADDLAVILSCGKFIKDDFRRYMLWLHENRRENAN